VHHGLHPKDLVILVFAVDDGKRKAPAVGTSKRVVERTPQSWIVLDYAQDTLDLIEELTTQAGGLFLVETDRLSILGQCLGM
jgi:hypothetical protein